MKIKKFFTNSVVLANNILRAFGYEVQNISRNPLHNLAGIRSRNIRTVLDVGANEGQFGSWILKMLPAVSVYSFEPLPSMFSKLVKATKSHKNWTAFNYALGNFNGEKEIYFHVEHPSSSSFLESEPLEGSLFPETKAKENLKVKCRMLDWWSDCNLSQISTPILLKLDVQGYEEEVLLGASKTLSQVDTVVIEVITQRLYKNQVSFPRLVDILNTQSFELGGVLQQGFDTQSKVVSLDIVFFKTENLKSSPK